VRAGFAALNRNKRSIALDLKHPQGLEAAKKLVASADIVVENYRSGVIDTLGLGYEDMRALNPRVIYVSITGFGSSGPRRDSPAVDLISQAHSGLLSFVGEPDRDPVRVPIPIGDQTAGLYSVIGILAALNWRGQTGEGQHIETSLLEGLLTMVGSQLLQYLTGGVVAAPQGTKNNMAQPNQVFRTADGLIAVAVATDRMWQGFCRAIDATELADDERYLRSADRSARRDELVEQLETILSERPTAAILDRLRDEKVICAPVNRVDQLSDDPQVVALGSIVSTTYGDESVPVVRNPLHFSATEPEIRQGVPRLSEHADEILRELGYDDDAITTMRADGAVV
jgi:crotonobetainyl-CoA:carnitine CoA-transferase CaiB-like acyl-CoA transferase